MGRRGGLTKAVRHVPPHVLVAAVCKCRAMVGSALCPQGPCPKQGFCLEGF